jgi:hypothetical protein
MFLQCRRMKDFLQYTMNQRGINVLEAITNVGVGNWLESLQSQETRL